MYATLLNIFFYIELSLSFIHLEHFFVRLIWILAWFKISRPSNDSFLGLADLNILLLMMNDFKWNISPKLVSNFRGKKIKHSSLGSLPDPRRWKQSKSQKKWLRKRWKANSLENIIYGSERQWWWHKWRVTGFCLGRPGLNPRMDSRFF